MAKRGAFILFEGIDRCGKTTQSKQLVDALKKAGTKVKHIRFPDRTTTIGKMIDAYLQLSCELDDRAVHLLFAANRWEAASKLRRDISEGFTVVCDRYSYSGCTYTASKNLPGLDLNWCKQPETGLPAPDAIFYLDISVEEAKRRGGYGEERYEKEDMQRRVRENYLKLKAQDEAALNTENSLAANVPKPIGVPALAPRWCIIDANRSPSDIFQEINSLTKRVISDAQSKPLACLNWG